MEVSQSSPKKKKKNTSLGIPNIFILLEKQKGDSSTWFHPKEKGYAIIFCTMRLLSTLIITQENQR